MKLIIGITGYPLSGKGTVADCIQKLLAADGLQVSRHRFSDVLRDTLDLWGIPHGRSNEQLLARLMREFGSDALSGATTNRLAKDGADAGILDGVRWVSDEKMIRGFAEKGIKSIIIYVSADADVRFARLEKRGRAGEEKTTREEFERQNLQDNEKSIPDIGSRADVEIENNGGDIAALSEKIKSAYTKSIAPFI